MAISVAGPTGHIDPTDRLTRPGHIEPTGCYTPTGRLAPTSRLRSMGSATGCMSRRGWRTAGRTGRRFVWLLVAAIVAASTCPCGAARAEVWTTVRIMSFNIRHAAGLDELLLPPNGWLNLSDPLLGRRHRVLSAIEDYGPDLLGVQEAFFVQVDDLLGGFDGRRLEGYAFSGVGRDDGQLQGETTGIFYRPDRFTLLDEGTFWLSSTPDVPGTVFAGSGSIRIASWVKLHDAQSRSDLLVLNTHWDNVSSSSRLQSAVLIRQQLADLAEGLPLIVMGDLNATETSSAVSTLRGAAANDGAPPLVDAYREVFPVRGPLEATYHNFTGSTAGSRIDYILHSPEWTAQQAAIVRTTYGGLYPSDHFPVTATLQIAVAVPEPAGSVLAAVGFFAALLVWRRR